jgi:hypothetical protein
MNNQFDEKVKLYQERVAAFMAQAREWCLAHGLKVKDIPTDILEEGLDKYRADSLRILSPIDQPLAELLPTGSAIIGAQGRINLIGSLARHAFLYQTGKGPAIQVTATTVAGASSKDFPTPLYRGIDGDGWYWFESSMRKAVRVDENTFLDLLTDVSDYEFQ